MGKTRGGSMTSCLSRSNSFESEPDARLIISQVPPQHRQARGGKRNVSESSDRMNSTQGSSSTSMESYCRICHDGESEEVLMRACRCQGSIKYVHHECLLNWVSRSGDLTCEICKYSYSVIQSRRKRLNEWHFPSIEIQGWLHIVLFLAFVAMLLTSLTWVIWSQTSSSSAAIFERTSAEIKYAYMLNGIFILTAVIGITLDSCRQGKKYFKRVLALNKELVIQEYVEKDDKEPEARKETVDNQTLLALSSRQRSNRNLSSTLRQERGSLCNSSQQNQPYSAVIGSTEFVEIDLDCEEDKNRTLLTDTGQTIKLAGNFERLSDLVETCI